jgi:hypothetical protein
MDKRYKRRLALWACLAIIGFAGALVLFNFQAYRDLAYVCENTASRKGFRRWFCGAETGRWYKESPVEAFMRKNYPDELTSRWTCYQGTGRNIFGGVIVRGHRRPGAVLYLNLDTLSRWAKHTEGEKIRALYQLLVSDDEERIRERVMAIQDEVWENKD